MARIYRRGGTWWGDWRDARGQRHRETLATRDREVAKKRLRERELAAPDSTSDGPALAAALTYLLDTVYAGRPAGTIHCYTMKARHLERLLGEHVPVRHVTREDVLQYRAARLAEGAAETSVAKEMVVLRLTLREQGIENVVPRVPTRYTPRTRHLSYDDALAVLEELPPKRRVWFMVAVYVGARASELDRVEWADVDLSRGWIRVRGRKTKASVRPVPIAAALRPWLEAWAENAEEGAVLEGWVNQRRDLARACERAGGRVGTARIGVRIARVTSNDLRRTFASWLVQAGVSNLVVARLLGHTSSRMVDLVYGQMAPATFESAMGLMPGCDAGVPREYGRVGRNKASGTTVAGASSGTTVPRAGIEPATRGFSVLRLVRATDGDHR